METRFSTGLYKQPWSRDRRGLLIFLLDQSGSMDVTVAGQSWKNADMATAILNHILVSVIEMAPYDPDTNMRKNYCDLIVFGYGDGVISLLNKTGLPVSLPALAAQSRGKQTVRIGNQDQEQFYWIEALGDSSKTETAEALNRAKEAVENWLKVDKQTRKLSFPPVVINITDGMHNGVGNPIDSAKRLCQLSTDDGNVLLFNCHLASKSAQRLTFINDVKQIRSLGLSDLDRQCAEQLFEMSSIIPDSMIERAQKEFKITLLPKARGFMFNATANDLIRFLIWGTRQNKESIK